ncbi:MAG: exosortase/archaeosortase family protein [Chthoniobacteraceae bacterium]
MDVLQNQLAGGVTGVQSPKVFTKPDGARNIIFAAAVVLGPALMLWHLHGLWNPDGEYAYGWAVPLLAAFLYKSRWDDRPAPSLPIEFAAFFAIAFALLALPARWLQEAAPERGVCTWSYAIGCVGISLSLISLAGGMAWFRWFTFPFVFMLTAVPWPQSLETPVTNSLMRGMAGATVEVLCLIGIPSAQSGNLVHIETGVVDIAEACSGIRSLQAMVMISLFLGELFRLKPARRILLMVLGLAVTLLANVIRTVALSSIGYSRGMSAVDHYHDTAGLAVLLLSLSITLITAYLLRPAKSPASIPVTSRDGLQLPLKLSLALLVWLSAVEISVEAWYRLHEPKWQGWSWDVQWPEHSEGFHFTEIPKSSLRLLMCDESDAATWKEPDGSDWSLYWIRWNPGNEAAEAAKVHRPDVCLNAEGAIMERDLGAHFCTVGGMQIPFHSYIFRLGEKTLHVFFCLYEEGAGPRSLALDPQFEAVDMVQRALKGQRHTGQQSLEIAVSGNRTELNAEEAFNARLGQLMRTRKSGIRDAKEAARVGGF